MNLKLSVNGTGGHSSFPPRHTSVGQLAAAITTLENNPHPATLQSAGPLLDFLGRESPFLLKMVFANLWFFRPIVFKMLEQGTQMNALIRTTTAVTIVRGGIKANVVPGNAYAVVNHRIAHNQSPEDVLAHDAAVINDPNVTLVVMSSLPPSPISDPKSFGFKAISHTVLQLFDDTIATPGLMIANTDTRHFWDLTKNIFRFCPLVIAVNETSSIHGRNERVSFDTYAQLVEFYYHLIRNTDLPYSAFH